MRIIKLDENIKEPTNSDGIYTIYSPKDILMGSGDIAKLELGFKVELEEGLVGVLLGRSGLTGKGIDPIEFLDGELQPLGGIIGRNNGLEWKILIKNFGSGVATIRKGDKVACFIIIKVETLE